MKLARLRLKNFRCYKEETSIDIDNLTVLVGKNDAGKSTIFDALAIFFDEAKIDADDASKSGDKSDVRIICEFDDLPDSLIIDADYQTSLKDEYLLNDHDYLEIHKVYNCSLKTPRLSGIYANAKHPNAEQLNDLLLLKSTELKKRAADLSVNTDSIDSRVNTLLRQAIWSSASELTLAEIEIPLDQETARKIWDQLGRYLPSYALFKSDRPSTDQDAEAQDPLKAAVKEALKQKESELMTLAEFVEQEVKVIAEQTVSKLKEMDSSLASQLKPNFSPPNWSSVFKISLTGDEDIPINKRGSGVRRLILINFFRAKAEQKAHDKNASSIIYAVEEPETSQHLKNQKMLMHAFYQLSELHGCQVMLSTHTPTLARLVPSQSLRFINIEDDNRHRIFSYSNDAYKKIIKSLGILPDHDVKIFIGVEGGNDINFLTSMSKMLIREGEEVVDLSSLEEQGEIVFFPMSGSNLTLWVSRLKNLNRPEFYVVDRNEEPPDISQNQNFVNGVNERENCKAILTRKREMENYIHPEAIKSVKPDVDITIGDFDDVPMIVARAIHDNSDSEKSWDELIDKKKEEKIRKAKSWLNTQAVEAMTPQMLNEIDPQDEIRNWLSEIKIMMDM